MNQVTPYDLELIEGCRKGKLKSQEKLYRAFYGYGMSVTYRYAYDEHEAMEVLNDSFMKVFRNINQYNPNHSFKAWFRKIIIHTAIDYYRKHKELAAPLEVVENEPDHYDLDGLKKLTIDDILSLLAQLPEIYRATFTLYEIEGYKHDEIADLLNVSVSTSRSNLTRAKQKLRALYTDKFGGA